ncbi:f3368b8b-90a2-40b8-b49c-0bf8dbf24358 [Thermothielavioides terrestris]|uniref:F3368b8b-90a2-40b8-b49c-0bf8dbf24358 n=1 Tax=Thermothielavioides terrestris TaxID=2587410 RepID=A0A3S5CXV9_9PEZI|nr:f3368b8b-90a2-40b8-b49c-0bf8dbf24358 [Thermothielavioides terrestris]
MQDLYRHYGSHSRWEKYDVPKCPIVEVTEIWVEDDDLSSPALVETKTIPSLDIDNWLEESSCRCFPDGACSRALRLVWVGQEGNTKRTSPSTKVLERMTKAWKLGDALDYARSCFAGVSATAPHGDTRVFTVAYHPKLVAVWSRPVLAPEEPTPETRAIVFAEGEERAELRRILGSKWSAATVRHPMFPALFCGLTLAHGLDNTLEDIKAAVRKVEARTGHHRFTSRHQTQPASGELGQLSAQMSGCAAKLANGTRKMKVVEAINDFIQQHATTSPAEVRVEARRGSIHYPADFAEKENTPSTAAESFSTSDIDLLRHRVQMQAVDTAYVQQRVQIQIAALFHLIAQQDNAIAFDAARATHSIAASSLEDSSSMKMLALVAMFFLPGSFVAALFSAPLFAWDEASSAGGGMGVATKPQFALFWAVTAPLTVLVFALYALWICFQKRRERGSAKDLDAIPI